MARRERRPGIAATPTRRKPFCPRGARAKLERGAVGSRHWTPLARVAGVALLALGLACWPGADVGGARTPAARAMLVYNPLIASYLVYLAAVGVVGILLWPA